MGERKFTLIELHFDGDAQFGPGRLGEALPALGDVAAEEETDDDGAEESGGRSPVGVVVALAVLVGIAVAVRKFRGGDDEVEEFEPSEEPDVIVDDD